MKITIELKTDSQAFEDNDSQETARILRELAKRLEGHAHFSPGHYQPLSDYNGDTVGSFDIY